MKLNYLEILKLDPKIRVAIFHNPDNQNLQRAFPQCFSGEGPSQIPWSLINSDGYIGKFAYDASPDTDLGPRLSNEYFMGKGIPIISIVCEGSGSSERPYEIVIPDNDSFWYDKLWKFESHEEDNANFRPFLWCFDNEPYLIVTYMFHMYATGIPLATIDFSK